jgi:uncharacterized membrane protein YqaE (UPF0057 family)
MKSDFSGVVFLFLLVLSYMLPALVATTRGVRRPAGLILLNLLLGWTILGWVGALIWAVQAETSAGTAGSIRQPMYQLGRCVRVVRGWIAPEKRASVHSVYCDHADCTGDKCVGPAYEDGRDRRPR